METRTATEVQSEITATEQALYACDYQDADLQAKLQALYQELWSQHGASWDRRVNRALNAR